MSPILTLVCILSVVEAFSCLVSILIAVSRRSRKLVTNVNQRGERLSQQQLKELLPPWQGKLEELPLHEKDEDDWKLRLEFQPCRNVVCSQEQLGCDVGVQYCSVIGRLQCNISSATLACVSPMYKGLLDRRTSAQTALIYFVRRVNLTNRQCDLEIKQPDEAPCERVDPTKDIVVGLLQNQQWDAGRLPARQDMSTMRAVRLVGGVFLLYPVCMLVMSSYALANGCFEGCGGWATSDFEVRRSIAARRTLADVSQGALAARAVGLLDLLHPSSLSFCIASIIWAFLEWAHYHSNVNHRYQVAILGAAVISGFLPVLRCEADVLTWLFSIVPWAIHLGLTFSDLLHSI